jgi:carbonic anhydrase/acetyltransferase-like protein (isoleucine patch superfamily)
MGFGFIRIVSFCGRLWHASKGVRFLGSAKLNGWPIVSMVPGSSITLGDSVVLTSWSRYTALGVKHPVILRTLATDAKISVGKNVGFSGTTICAVKSIEIGDNCLIGADVTIVDTDFHPLKPEGRRFAPIGDASSKEVSIGNNVFIGAGSYILKGSRIGDNAVIGAGSVLAGEIPENMIAYGNPCKVHGRVA